MRFSLLTAALGAALALAGCQFKGVSDPSLSKRDVEWMALMPQADIDPILARYEVNDPTGTAATTSRRKSPRRHPRAASACATSTSSSSTTASRPASCADFPPL